jgi:hypothetical protein
MVRILVEILSFWHRCETKKKKPIYTSSYLEMERVVCCVGQDSFSYSAWFFYGQSIIHYITVFSRYTILWRQLRFRIFSNRRNFENILENIDTAVILNR